MTTGLTLCVICHGRRWIDRVRHSRSNGNHEVGSGYSCLDIHWSAFHQTTYSLGPAFIQEWHAVSSLLTCHTHTRTHMHGEDCMHQLQ